ncbi:MAG: hypothetical protein OSJ59_04590 [Lachnospiraceae bacterium]|nr:hypothetical protein [Lachnospiraceae bacterium]
MCRKAAVDGYFISPRYTVTAVVISILVSAGYLVWTETAFNAKIAVELIALMYLSFLAATNGYDKVIQAIKQIQEVRRKAAE